MMRLTYPEDVPIEAGLVSRAMSPPSARSNPELQLHKNLLEYDDVMNKQRQVIYAERPRSWRARTSASMAKTGWIEDTVESALGNLHQPPGVPRGVGPGKRPVRLKKPPSTRDVDAVDLSRRARPRVRN